jgi:hypothetical protein
MLFDDPGAESAAGVDVKPRRRRHVVIPKKVYSPPSPTASRESAIDRLRRVVSIELPMVWVVLGSVGLVVLIAMVFLLGQHRGMKQGRQATLERIRGTQVSIGLASDGIKPQVEARAEMEDAAEAAAPSRTGAGSAASSAGNRPQAPAGTLISANKPTAGSTSDTAGRGPAAVTDLRKPGLNYLVLAMYNEAEAHRLVAFLKQRGVEAQAIPVHNGRLFCVIALRGFDAASLRTTYPAFRQQILALGREWQTRFKGPTNLSDAWPQRYDG